MTNFLESDLQFLARMLIATREGDALNQDDAQRLNEVATFGHSNQPVRPTVTTLPEERHQGNVDPHSRRPEVVSD